MDFAFSVILCPIMFVLMGIFIYLFFILFVILQLQQYSMYFIVVTYETLGQDNLLFFLQSPVYTTL